jgi:hypothetical protein
MCAGEPSTCPVEVTPLRVEQLGDPEIGDLDGRDGRDRRPPRADSARSPGFTSRCTHPERVSVIERLGELDTQGSRHLDGQASLFRE